MMFMGKDADNGEHEKISPEDFLKALGGSRTGLSSAEARQRLEKYGYNEIPEEKTNPLKKFLGYFWGPIAWMIEAAVILSALIQHWTDCVIISILLLLNAIVGFWQEKKADNAIELLKQKMALEAQVLRDGEWTEIASRELVPGDIVRVRLGDIVPADIRLMEDGYLMLDESALTGESLPVEKHASDLAYSGSVIQKGEMNALVVATGTESYLGKTTKLVAEVRKKSHFQKAIIKIGDYLIVLAGLMVALIFVVAMFRHTPLTETLQFALVLTVAAIPAALPTVLSVSMAVGAIDLARKGAIVSKLVSIEEMAGMDVLCSDKTGTITQNKLTLAEVIPVEASGPDEVLLGAALASRKEDRDSIDSAVLAGAEAEENVMASMRDLRVTDFKPFDPVIKHSEATVDAGGKTFTVVKGAPQVILELAGEKEGIAAEVEKTVNAFAEKGYRALGVGRKDGGGNWKMLGLLALYDPPYEDSAQTILDARAMNVDIKMVTGDHAAIAREIAGQVNLGTNITTAESLTESPETVEKVDGFAQVFPEHKYRIVKLLQDEEHIVGMTGDGVNDAPALKKADVGIAVVGATDAAKSAADIVFTRPGLSVIVDAIRESRMIFQRMKSYSVYRIAETVRVLFFITLSILIFDFYPVTALMIVLLALFNDAPIMAIAYDNVEYSDRPEKWNMREVLGMATFLGLVGVFSSIIIFYIGDNTFGLSRDLLQSFIFLKLAVAGHLTIFLARTRGHFWSIKPSGLLFWSTVGTKILATIVVIYGFYISPISPALAGFVWLYSLAAFVITDFLKVRFYEILDHRGVVFSR
jgi:H+-transporting ATPase